MSDVTAEAEATRLREQALRRRQRVLADHKNRIESVGGQAVPEKPVETKSVPQGPGFVRSISEIANGFLSLAILPLAILAALITYREEVLCWNAGLENGFIMRLATICPRGVTPLSLFLCLQAARFLLFLLLRQPTNEGRGFLGALKFVSPGLVYWGNVGYTLFSYAQFGMQVARDFCVMLLFWKLALVGLQAL
eukprot:Protomagalhaensia_sp_Gyna_25__2755@NODE_2589_length_995_cov_26_583682_g2151_i0_p1_GENE_NODE_2589_length_995_cov_26_583682_g2151_i0NODE_2589_length_995_cov_26_583682_g2151_i0_p1_ORF_typecomplete_len204_score29_73FLYWCH_u/PF16662_5/4_4FLYWCH_u/PF16662_5/8_4e03_NODE_2589_length_995_cov_26_583682_g2151_i033614